MKKQILTALVLTGLSAAVAYATPTAVPGAGVVNSVHDMSAAVGAVDFGNNGRVCAFCHTPHHAVDMGSNYTPLWSRSNSNATTTYTPYQSATFDVTLQPGFVDAAVGPTRLCMSCHDGSIAPDQHYGQAGTTAKLTTDTFGGAGVGANMALGNDHPVGFDYASLAIGPTSGDVTTITIPESQTQKNYIRSLGSGATALKYNGNALNITVAERLYNGNTMTCATCHDVHNKKNKFSTPDTADFNYLVLAPQNGSALCLTCHIK